MTPTEDSGTVVNEPGPAEDELKAGLGIYRRRLLLGVLIVLSILAVSVVLLLMARDSGEPSVRIDDIGPSWDEIAEQVPPDPGRRYSDEELGLYERIDQVVFYRPYFARVRTIDDFNYMRDGDSDHERERRRFEIDIEAAMLFSRSSLPADIGEGGALEEAYYGWIVKCLSPAGFPDAIIDPDTQHEMPIYEAEDEQLASYESASGFTRDEFYDLRYDCARRAAGYPMLDPEVRDEMIGRLKRHYLQSVYDQLCHGYIAEVPIVPHDRGDETETRVSLNSTSRCGDSDQELGREAFDPREVTRVEVFQSDWAAQELISFKLLGEIGALEYLDRYVADIPLAASFIAEIELNTAIIGKLSDLDDGSSGDEQLLRFEVEVLSAALHDTLWPLVEEVRSKPSDQGSDVLRDTFLGALEECGHRAGGPGMTLFAIRDGRARDPQWDGTVIQNATSLVYTSGLSYFEYLELLHECARHAATYPTFDPELRQELLAPQRVHFATAILDWLDNEFAPADIPERYRAEIKDLREHGW